MPCGEIPGQESYPDPEIQEQVLGRMAKKKKKVHTANVFLCIPNWRRKGRLFQMHKARLKVTSNRTSGFCSMIPPQGQERGKLFL